MLDPASSSQICLRAILVHSTDVLPQNVLPSYWYPDKLFVLTSVPTFHWRNIYHTTELWYNFIHLLPVAYLWLLLKSIPSQMPSLKSRSGILPGPGDKHFSILFLLDLFSLISPFPQRAESSVITFLSILFLTIAHTHTKTDQQFHFMSPHSPLWNHLQDFKMSLKLPLNFIIRTLYMGSTR